jgi:5-methylcytosine-specific restriction endonuclease McrA
MTAADFTCQLCGWEHPNAPHEYDGSYSPWCRIVHEVGYKLDRRPWMRTRTIHLEIDHILPRIRGGTSEPDNLQVLCNRCNARKGIN